MEGKIHIYTGDGKGKTTAAMGLAVRAAGSGMKVYIAQLLKDGSSSELNILRKIENITCHSCEKNFGFIKYMDQETLKEAKEYYRKYFREVIDGAKSVDLLVLDEFMAAYQYDMIDREEALYFLKNKREEMCHQRLPIWPIILQIARWSSIPTLRGFLQERALSYDH